MIATGVYMCKGKRSMLPRWWSQLIMVALIASPHIQKSYENYERRYYEDEKGMLLLIMMFIIFMLSTVLLCVHRYTVQCIDKEVLRSIVKEELEKYDVDNGTQITVRKTEINLRPIRKHPSYKQIVEDLKQRIKSEPSRGKFNFEGLLMIAMGVGFIYIVATTRLFR